MQNRATIFLPVPSFQSFSQQDYQLRSHAPTIKVRSIKARRRSAHSWNWRSPLHAHARKIKTTFQGQNVPRHETWKKIEKGTLPVSTEPVCCCGCCCLCCCGCCGCCCCCAFNLLPGATKMISALVSSIKGWTDSSMASNRWPWDKQLEQLPTSVPAVFEYFERFESSII